jgi:hypothetical protein
VRQQCADRSTQCPPVPLHITHAHHALNIRYDLFNQLQGYMTV